MRTSAAAAGLAALCLAHIGPAATWLAPIRDLATPGLAGRGRPDHIALTFDDGPDPVSTPRFLDALDDLGVKATFFQLGSRMSRATRPHWFRPPYGVLTTGLWHAARSLDLRPALWGAWGRDWIENGSPGHVHRTITPRLRGGVTLLLHDTSPDGHGEAWRSTLAALPGIVEHCRAEGYGVRPLGEHW